MATTNQTTAVEADQTATEQQSDQESADDSTTPLSRATISDLSDDERIAGLFARKVGNEVQPGDLNEFRNLLSKAGYDVDTDAEGDLTSDGVSLPALLNRGAGYLRADLEQTAADLDRLEENIDVLHEVLAARRDERDQLADRYDHLRSKTGVDVRGTD